jgi:hypothetical protein
MAASQTGTICRAKPDCPFEYRKPSNWGYLDRREHPVALDYPAVDVFNRWDGIDAIHE